MMTFEIESLVIRGEDLKEDDQYIFGNSEIFYGGYSIWKETETKGMPYLKKELIAENEDYIVIGIHSEYEGCYLYMDYAIALYKKDLTVKKIRCYIDHSRQYREGGKIQLIQLRGNHAVFSSVYRTVSIDLSKLFEKEASPGTKILTKNGSLLSDCFDYEILSDGSVFLTLNSSHTINDLLRYPGFDNRFDSFKIWDIKLDSPHHSSEIDVDSFRILHIDSERRLSEEKHWKEWAESEPYASWIRGRELLECIKQKIPNYPIFLKEEYLMKIEK